MGKTIIYYGDLVPSSTVTASSETTGYEKEFAYDYTPSSKWMATGAAANYNMDFGADVHQAAVYVGGSNLIAADTTYKYWTGNASPAAVTDYDLAKKENSFIEVGDTERYGRVGITELAGLIEFGKVYVAQYKFELPKDIKRGYSGGTMTQWITNKGAYGQIHKEKQYSKVIYQFEISGMGDVQKKILDETIRIEENVIFWDGETQKAYFGSIDFGQPKFVKSDVTGALWNISGTFEEAL